MIPHGRPQTSLQNDSCNSHKKEFIRIVLRLNEWHREAMSSLSLKVFKRRLDKPLTKLEYIRWGKKRRALRFSPTLILRKYKMGALHLSNHGGWVYRVISSLSWILLTPRVFWLGLGYSLWPENITELILLQRLNV